MPTASLYTDDFLGPVSADQPAGADLRWTAEWDRIKEARRADDDLEPGQWTKKERKTADWRLVEELASVMLRERSKDLQLALWLTEAAMKRHGFPGLQEGLRLTRELMVRYWDNGLFPRMEDGPEDRSGPFEWLDNKLVDSIRAIPITVRGDGGRDYSLIDLLEARRTGSEASCRGADGETDAKKKRAYETALAQGRLSLEMLDGAVAATKRASYEELNSEFQQTYDEFRALDKVIDEKFGEAAPNLSTCRNALNEIRHEVGEILARKRKEEPDPAPNDSSTQGGESGVPANPVTLRFPLSVTDTTSSTGSPSGSWHDAETLIRSGQVDKGLAEMVRLSVRETSGRNRFQRKLLLAEVCLARKHERLARSILEELAEQIDKLQLELWESSELIASVWTRLYQLYKEGPEAADRERAAKLYERLCRLDPWQALGCGER